MPRTPIAVLFGGVSEEHAVSVKSAREVAGALDLDAYEPVFVGITRGGEWLLCDAPSADWESGLTRPVVLSPDRGAHGLLVQEEGGSRVIRVDAVLPVLHGRQGEDGAIQGLLELSGIPYVGCGIQASVLCMDKSLAYLVAASAGVPTPEFHILTGDELPTGLAYPVFVKPARSGSSFGVTRVDGEDALASAVATAREYDSTVLIEGAVVGAEVGCAVLEEEGGLVVGEVDRIRLSSGFFRVHQESAPETGSENSTVLVPADISADERRAVQETAKTLYRALGCQGLARVDLFLTAGGRVMLNEVNTLPGLTSYSRYPRMMAAAGLPLGDVLDRLLRFALVGRRR